MEFITKSKLDGIRFHPSGKEMMCDILATRAKGNRADIEMYMIQEDPQTAEDRPVYIGTDRGIAYNNPAAMRQAAEVPAW